LMQILDCIDRHHEGAVVKRVFRMEDNYVHIL